MRARVNRVIFRAQQDDFKVVEAYCGNHGGSFVAVGQMPGLEPGLTVNMVGRWVENRKFGRQFRVDSFSLVLPSDKTGIEQYLGSGMIKGLGKVLASRLVLHFKEETLDIIQHHPEKLTEVPGIGEGRSKVISRAWKAQVGMRETMTILTAQGVPPGMAARIYNKYGSGSVKILKENPYKLVEDIKGIGFVTADNLAEKLGVSRDSVFRARAGLVHVLWEAQSRGHVFLPRQELIENARRLLEPSNIDLEAALDELAADRSVVLDTWNKSQAVYVTVMNLIEKRSAKRLALLLRARMPAQKKAIPAIMSGFEKEHGLKLSTGQREAVETALTSSCTIVTGGPGTGKTTLVKAVVNILSKMGRRVKLCAPTGRAAKRLAEATSMNAMTIHRLLEYSPKEGRFKRNREFPLNADMVVVDEVSMVDLSLFDKLLDAISPGCRLLLVGDKDQLPSVGPGQVLADLIDSNVLPVVRLKTIFRQARQSLIVRNAHKILRGDSILDEPASGERQDFYFIRKNDPEEILSALKLLVAERIPKLLGVDPMEDIQVLCPMRRGLLGTETLNHELKSLLNPSGAELKKGNVSFRMMDRVMQVRNNYDLQVFNGEVGRVVGIEASSQTLQVSFDDRIVPYANDDIDDLVHAYACTIHKSQGSEYSAVVIPLHTQHYIMLKRNLLYTAVTRGKRLVVLVGSEKALQLAIANNRVEKRFTKLAERLRCA
ncbi:MAG: ATP-dependent RecD-like DNA helicase [Deltaproteobacteria bacterium]|nr:ATP-dependent RecD-like DNA helicase [Deltaproteobacteria bacterium]